MKSGTAAIHDTLKSPPLREVLQHWQEVRGDRRMPAWKDIDPTILRRNLPILWSWRYDRRRDKFTGRLAGEAIIHLLGKTPRHMEMVTFFGTEDYDRVFARFKRVIDGPTAMIINGPVYGYGGRCGIGERLALPLASDGETPDEVWGATCYELLPSTDPAMFEAQSESVIHFML
jgi:hypothetical protein